MKGLIVILALAGCGKATMNGSSKVNPGGKAPTEEKAGGSSGSGSGTVGGSDGGKDADAKPETEAVTDQKAKGTNAAKDSGKGSEDDGKDDNGELTVDDGKIRCKKRPALMYAMQPAGSSPGYEAQGDSFAAALKNAGFAATAKNRKTLPTLTTAELEKYKIVVFFSGCGGATGMPSAADMAAIKTYYEKGGSIAIITDDSFGDSSAQGSCHARVNPIANALGVSFSGLVDNKAHGCATVDALDPVLKGIKLGRNTSAQLTLTGQVAWGGTKPALIGKLKNGQPAEALIKSNGKHGAAQFSPDFGSLACDGVKYLTNLVEHLGCAE